PRPPVGVEAALRGAHRPAQVHRDRGGSAGAAAARDADDRRRGRPCRRAGAARAGRRARRGGPDSARGLPQTRGAARSLRGRRRGARGRGIRAMNISVVIPTLNRPDALPRTLTALADQSFKDFEVIVVEDANNEAPLPAADPALELRTLRAEQQGASYARNAG